MAHPSLLTTRGGEIRITPRPGPSEAGRPSALPSALPVLRPMASPVVLMPRRVPGGVLATLDALPAEALPRLGYEGPASGLRRAMRATLAERLARPRWLANWLLDDVLDQAAVLTALTGCASLRVSLRARQAEGDMDAATDGAADAPLASAESRCRLVTAYRGPGFDWLPPRAAAGLAAGLRSGEAPAAAALRGLLRRLPRGDVAILRRDRDGPGVAHRAAGGGVALLLTIDAADRPKRAAVIAHPADLLQ